jgi:hypothetical protein
VIPWLLVLPFLAGPEVPPQAAPPEIPTPAYGVQPALEQAASRFAALWSRGDVSGIAALLGAEGVRLQLGQGGYASVGVRQATAAIRDFHQAFRTSGARVLRVAEVGGTPRRGFAELECSASEGGSREVTGYAVFVGFLQEGGEWRVSEIRVLR